MKLLIPEVPQSTGALGAAHLARNLYARILKEGKINKMGSSSSN
jgi:hypothetical protein